VDQEGYWRRVFVVLCLERNVNHLEELAQAEIQHRQRRSGGGGNGGGGRAAALARTCPHRRSSCPPKPPILLFKE